MGLVGPRTHSGLKARPRAQGTEIVSSHSDLIEKLTDSGLGGPMPLWFLSLQCHLSSLFSVFRWNYVTSRSILSIIPLATSLTPVAFHPLLCVFMFVVIVLLFLLNSFQPNGFFPRPRRTTSSLLQRLVTKGFSPLAGPCQTHFRDW